MKLRTGTLIGAAIALAGCAPSLPPPAPHGLTFRTMDHRPAQVFVNGTQEGSAPHLWPPASGVRFDPKIPVPAWPPPGATPALWRVRRTAEGAVASEIDVWVAGGFHDQEAFASFRSVHPHVGTDEQILFIRVRGGGRAPSTGAVRVKLAGRDGALYRWTNYDPVLSQEDENASRFRHTLWFQAARDE